MKYDEKRALELLRAGTGQADAAFRDGQEDAIRYVVGGRGRLLVVEKTGWGKSFVYFIAVKLLREGGLGPALLISPLLALMRNQIAAAERMGVRAATINSANTAEWDAVIQRVARNEVDILLISPERLANEAFGSRILARIANRVSLLVVDEAHCVSDWGHDFRPHYRLIERMVRTLPRNLRVLGTTATANNRVMEDLRQVLGPDLQVIRGDLVRDSLTLQTLSLGSQQERLAWLAQVVPQLPGSGIIYALTVRDAYRVAEWLQSRGLRAEAYTGGMPTEDRVRLEDALARNEVKALVATTALGMGYDKPDLWFVVHYQAPGSVVAYYQQVGRAGRALDNAYGVLLTGQEDQDINAWFISSAFPTRDEVQQVLGELESASDGLSLPELDARLNIPHTRIEKTLQLLSLESPAPIVKQGPRWQLTAASLGDAFWERAERLTALRQAEHAQMQAYAALPFGQHMAFLVQALDGDASRVHPPRLPPLRGTADEGLVREAVDFLRRSSLVIEPRKRWPNVGMPRYGVTGNIPPELLPQPGRALCVWGDAGWGRLVRDGKYRDHRFADELVAACANMSGEWDPQPRPTWVTCVPSRRHSDLVPDFAQRLADALGLPFAAVIAKTDDRPPQKEMANSVQQAHNLDGALAMAQDVIPSGPVLLVDDMVDSKWTLTVCAWLLRKNGSGAVWPLALAYAGKDD